LNLPASRTYLSRCCCAFLILCLPAAPRPAVSSGATPSARQTSVVAQQAAAPVAPVTLKFPVFVMDKKGKLISGLTKEEFTVTDGKTEREINYFNADELPASIAVLIDSSGSMQPRVLRAARYAASRFLAQGHPANEYFVGEFSDDWRSLIGWMGDSQSVAEASHKLSAASAAAPARPNSGGRGQTALYDACDAALDALLKRSKPRRILLLITDGQDNRSRVTFKEVRRKLIASNVQIYGIGLAAPEDPESLRLSGQAILDELTAASGGRAYFPQSIRDTKELDLAIDQVASELRHQYVIGFTPANAAPGGKWNKVKIKVTPRRAELKELLVRSREGYFSPSPPAP